MNAPDQPDNPQPKQELSVEDIQRITGIARQIRKELDEAGEDASNQDLLRAKLREYYRKHFPEDYSQVQDWL